MEDLFVMLTIIFVAGFLPGLLGILFKASRSGFRD
jgi:hypothetical protein